MQGFASGLFEVIIRQAYVHVFYNRSKLPPCRRRGNHGESVPGGNPGDLTKKKDGPKHIFGGREFYGKNCQDGKFPTFHQDGISLLPIGGIMVFKPF